MGQVIPFPMQKRLPNRVRELRKLHGLTLEVLAARVGTTAQHLSDIERGNRRLSTHWMALIARQLKVGQADLLNEEDRGAPRDEGQARLNELYSAATDDQQRALLHVAEAMLGFKAEPDLKKAG